MGLLFVYVAIYVQYRNQLHHQKRRNQWRENHIVECIIHGSSHIAQRQSKYIARTRDAMSFNQYSCGFSSNYWPSKGLCHINGRCYASIHYLSPTDGLRIHIEVLAIVLNVGWGNITYAELFWSRDLWLHQSVFWSLCMRRQIVGHDGHVRFQSKNATQFGCVILERFQIHYYYDFFLNYLRQFNCLHAD